MVDLPAPPIPAEADLRDFAFMPIDINRLFGSAFHARSTDAEWRAGVTLWLKSYHQVPAGSLPEDDIELCRLPPGRRSRAEGCCRSPCRADRVVSRRRLGACRCRLQADPLRHGGRSRGNAAMDRGVRNRDTAGAGAIPRAAAHCDRWHHALMVGPWPHRPGTLRALLTILKGACFVVCRPCERYGTLCPSDAQRPTRRSYRRAGWNHSSAPIH